MNLSAKHRREHISLHALLHEHGYMLAHMPREVDRYTTQVRGIGRGKITMTPARIVRLIVPDDSYLGKELALDKPKKRARKKRAAQ